MSRKPRPDDLDRELEWIQGDLAKGTNLPLALNEVDLVVHLATSPSNNAQKVDLEGTKRLIEAASDQKILNFIYPSIIGVEKIPMEYYQHKLAAEKYIENAGVPFTILRTAQFHTLIDSGLRYFNKLPYMILLPRKFQFQSIDPAEVAQRLASIMGGGAAGRVPDFTGPEIMTLGKMAKQWFEGRGEPVKKCFNLPIPGKVARAFRQGENTCKDCQKASTTWEEWLTLQYAKKRRNTDS